MNFTGAILAFCVQYAIACTPDNVAATVVKHLGAPYDQITWCCGTLFSGRNGEVPDGVHPTHWELEKPHTMLCSFPPMDGRLVEWSDGIGSIYMGHEREPDYNNYCAIWLHKGTVPTS